MISMVIMRLLGILSGFNGLLERVIAPDVGSSKHDSVFSAGLDLAHAKMAGLVSAAKRYILPVLSVGHAPKIRPSVIKSVVVDMVNLAVGKVARHIEPYKAMNEKLLVFVFLHGYTYKPVSLFGYPASKLSLRRSVSGALSAGKIPGFGAVMEKGFDIILSNGRHNGSPVSDGYYMPFLVTNQQEG